MEPLNANDINMTHFARLPLYLERSKREFEQKFFEPFRERGKLDDFKIMKTIGTGSFGRVIFVKNKKTDRASALKLLEKAHVVKTKQVTHIMSEIKTMYAFNFPFLIQLEFFFKDNVYLCIGMPFINGGEMFAHLRQQKQFSEDLAKFYASQVVLVLEYIHFIGIVYRDLKPENILIDRDGYIRVTDYGFCKKIDNQRTYTLCGTPEYLAPEVILSQGYNKSVDWWALGVLIFEMTAGHPPFFAKDPMKIYEKIVAGKFTPPNHFSKNLKSIVSSLLQVDRSKRIGILKDGPEDVKMHAFFKNVEWDEIFYKRFEPPFKPKVLNEYDCSNFDNYEEVAIKTSSKILFEKEFEVITVK